MKKNNTAEKTILEAQQISEALKEGTKNSLRDIMTEAISNIVKESCNEDKDEDEFEEEDVDTEETPKDTDEEVNPNEEDASDEGQEDDGDDEWSDMEDYKVGDNDYDFTSMDGDDVLKVYNKLGDDDKIFVKPEGDGKYEVKDEETGSDFVIELDPEALGDADDACEDGECEFEITPDEDEDETEFEISSDDDENGNIEFGIEGDEDEPDEDEEIELDINDDEDEDDDKFLNEENLGYTDSYQKDVFAKKFNMKEPANPKATYSMDGGAPEGAEKPWAGKGDMKPFSKKVNEGEGCEGCDDQPIDEAIIGHNSGALARTTTKKNQHHHGQVRNNSHKGNYEGGKTELTSLEESARKIYNKAKQIQAENKQYKQALGQIKKSLYEAAVLNVTLGQVVKLLKENTTTAEEKNSIVERFNNVKTIQESKNLYNTISRELNESKKGSVILERTISAAPNLNETTIYQSNPALQMMERMNKLETYYKK